MVGWLLVADDVRDALALVTPLNPDPQAAIDWIAGYVTVRAYAYGALKTEGEGTLGAGEVALGAAKDGVDMGGHSLKVPSPERQFD